MQRPRGLQMRDVALAAMRRLRTAWIARRSRCVLTHGPGLHIGAGTRLWAPDSIRIGRQVYIGKDVDIGANCDIGDYCLIANRVAIVGRRDHEFRTVGVPIRFGRWTGGREGDDPVRAERVVLESDVWIGFGAILLTAIRVGRGAIVGAGAVVTCDVDPYAIVAGNPAREVGRRFCDPQAIAAHERAVARGRFLASERGYQHWVVEPGEL